MGYNTSVHLEKWPLFNSEAIKEDNYELVIQVNGKVRDRITLKNDTNESQIKESALKRPNVRKWINNKEIRKIIIVKGKIMNIVI